MNTFITYFQLAGLGFTLGISGGCLLSCIPAITAYIAGRNISVSEKFVHILVFLSARLTATVFFGVIAGASGFFLRKIFSGDLLAFTGPVCGTVMILLSIPVLLGDRWMKTCARSGENISLGGVIILGLSIGFAPCPAFIALFFEIALMSKGIFDGMLYALFFGAGLFAASLAVISAAVGIFSGFFAGILRSSRSKTVFRFMCAGLMIILGIGCFK